MIFQRSFVVIARFPLNDSAASVSSALPFFLSFIYFFLIAFVSFHDGEDTLRLVKKLNLCSLPCLCTFLVQGVLTAMSLLM